MKNENKNYNVYRDTMQKAADVNFASAVLGWDQEVYMPPKSAPYRGRQLATLAAIAHDMLTDEKHGTILQELNADEGLNDAELANVRLSLYDYEKNKKLPSAFVEELSTQASECFNAWLEARKQNDFSIFAPSLAKMIALKKKQAELYGYEGHPYDALLNDYERGITVAALDPVFEGIKKDLPVLLDKIKSVPQVSNDSLHQFFQVQKQWDFSLEVLKQMGYDFEAGRQDYSEHPFTTSFSATDVRVTTRADENNFASMLWSCIHEGGHGLYEQGLPEEEYGLPLGEAASLGIHESQSRLWENCIGRGYDFWEGFYPKLKNYFKSQLGKVSLEDFYKAMNKVAPSLIRTEADEVTYHFHVLIRYEIEKQLICGDIDVNSIPALWNSMYEKYLGVTPPDDKSGVLQDVHWAHGSFGYFPTYTLGSFYAAQLFEQVQKDIPFLLTMVADGEFGNLLKWLREKVHIHGRRYTSEELCTRITGRGLDASSFMRYITKKYTRVYGLKQ